MREIRLSGSEGGGDRKGLSLPLSPANDVHGGALVSSLRSTWRSAAAAQRV
jgi:hypothetical protein